MDNQTESDAGLKEEKKFREWGGFVFALIALLISLASYNDAQEASRKADHLAVEELLADSWDLLGGRKGTTLIVSFTDGEGDLELARRKIDAALVIDPSNAKAYRYHAAYLRATGQDREAVGSYEQSIELNPFAANTFINYGLVLADLGRTEEALAAYDTALELGGCEAIILVNKARALSDDPDQPQFVEMIEKINLLIESDMVGLTTAERALIRILLQELGRLPGITMAWLIEDELPDNIS